MWCHVPCTYPNTTLNGVPKPNRSSLSWLLKHFIYFLDSYTIICPFQSAHWHQVHLDSNWEKFEKQNSFPLAPIRPWTERMGQTLCCIRNSPHYLKGGYGEVEVSLFSHITSNSTCGHGPNLCQWGFSLDVSKCYLLKKAIRCWNGLPRAEGGWSHHQWRSSRNFYILYWGKQFRGKYWC